MEPPPPRGSSAGSWIIVILFLIFAGVVGYGGYQVFYGGQDVTPPPPGKKVMPDLLGMEAEQAKALLASRDLTATEMRESNDDVPEGLVCRQEPAARTVLSDETPILYWISDGPSIFAMPDVTRMSQDAAKRRIREEGYKGEFGMKKEQSDEVPKGQVIRTEPEIGAMVQRDASVTLVLSDGEEQKLHGVYRPGSAPLLPGAENVFVRIEIENPTGSEPVAMWYDTLKPGDPIPDQHFDYVSGKRVVVRMLVGPDEMGDLEQYEEKFYGPPAP
ncbi:MAG: Serine/threonine-protein kinase PK-1 [bacterium ADurb.Bin429]|nr:MAG: Serine/threonine-protein kinase PK-1 [bacterium ADurb.Bin429]